MAFFRSNRTELSRTELSKSELRLTLTLFATAIIAVVLAVGFASVQDQSETTTNYGNSSARSADSERANQLEAYTCAQIEITHMLKSPSTAEFPWVHSESATARLDAGKYLVRSYVDSQNSFGAMIRSGYECVVQLNSGVEDCKATCAIH